MSEDIKKLLENIKIPEDLLAEANKFKQGPTSFEDINISSLNSMLEKIYESCGCNNQCTCNTCDDCIMQKANKLCSMGSTLIQYANEMDYGQGEHWNTPAEKRKLEIEKRIKNLEFEKERKPFERKKIEAMIKTLTKMLHEEIDHQKQMKEMTTAGGIGMGASIIGSHITKKLSESRICTKTANSTRNSLMRFAQKLVDSSCITPLSNFESYQEQDDIVLRFNIYGRSKKLKNVKEEITNKLESCGFTLDGTEMPCFNKDNIQVTVHPVKKAYRSGPYQNREVPQLGIEIKGPKKFISEDPRE